IQGMALQTCWDGLAAGQWNTEQLATLEAEIQKIDLFPQILRVMQGERAYFTSSFDLFASMNAFERYAFQMKIYQGLSPRAPVYIPLSAKIAMLLGTPQYSFNRALLAGNQWFEQHALPAIKIPERRIDADLIDAKQLPGNIFLEPHMAPLR